VVPGETRRPTVLVVVEDLRQRALLVRAFAQEGFSAIGVETAAAAREAIDRDDPAVLVTGFVLPGTTGVDLVAALARDLRDLAPPAILLCAAADTLGDHTRGHFVRVFGLSFRLSELMDAVREAAARPRRRKSAARMLAVGADDLPDARETLKRR
jgi:DNA-binding NtrC family response regulator